MMNMNRTRLFILSILMLAVSCTSQTYEWKTESMDGSRTGCLAVSGENVNEALGCFQEDGTYRTPNGNIYQSSSTVAKVASIVHGAQPKMARVKTVIAYSEEEMPTAKHETKLSNWVVDFVMQKVASLSGKRVDVGICNFGGIRVDMPQGNVILDDMLSMFPFKNTLVYLELKGSELRKIFEKMAATTFQAVGGVEILVENKQLTKALIGGKPIEDDKLYGVATISFLLYGGDSLTLAENAVNMQVYDVLIIDAALGHIASLKAHGKNITAPAVTHVTIK